MNAPTQASDLHPPDAAPDDVARAGAIAIAAGRVALGLAMTAATRPSLAALGFDDPDAGTMALARLAGGRDIALGLHGLLARNDRDKLAEASAIGAAVDLGDGLAFGAALATGDLSKRAAVNAPLIAVAVVAGGWVTARLRG